MSVQARKPETQRAPRARKKANPLVKMISRNQPSSPSQRRRKLRKRLKRKKRTKKKRRRKNKLFIKVRILLEYTKINYVFEALIKSSVFKTRL